MPKSPDKALLHRSFASSAQHPLMIVLKKGNEEPSGHGAFPRFVGTLKVEADEDYGTCSLAIEGAYDPPLGLLGDAFDAAVGRKIAKATARQLLRELRKMLEEEHARSHVHPEPVQQAAKASNR